MNRIPPKRRIAEAYSRKAVLYDRHADIQLRMSRDLADMIYQSGVFPEGFWIDLGCGTGQLCRLLSRSHGVRMVGLDIAGGCLERARTATALPVNADIDALPFRPHSVAAVVTASTLQWIGDPGKLLHAIRGLIKSGGFLGFSVFLEGTLTEFFTIRKHRGYQKPVQFTREGELTRELECAGFTLHRSAVVEIRKHYPDPFALLRSLANTGTGISTGAPMSPGQLRNFAAEYRNEYGDGNGVWATYRSMTGIALPV